MCLEYPPPALTISITEPSTAWHSKQSSQVKSHVPSCPHGMYKHSSDMAEFDIARATRHHKFRPSKVGVGRLVTFWDGVLPMVYHDMLEGTHQRLNFKSADFWRPCSVF